ncbi:MAG: asparagine synthase (glutamine-hydrolyzing) [Gemmatimonadaceae bacterium]|nr:asparagine synthase (glutamine-hydrolyzing) [Gemmatimonadaceae bacterium]
MCGITGILDFVHGGRGDLIDRFTDALAHRGPDGRGVYTDGPVSLGHRRLSILDPSPAGACPMAVACPDGTTVYITFNGEVYNFLELRDQLRADGYRFHTETDTEVVAAAFHRWGDACQLRFNGMWAFAIWSPSTQTLFLSRDRFGVKPLYVAVAGTRVAFASEIKAFLALPDFTPRLSAESAEAFFTNPVAYDGTMLTTAMRGVHRVPPGHSLTVTPQGAKGFKRWWETREHLPVAPVAYDEQVEGFRERFLNAVRLRMRSDVRIGTSLSGGLDSSAVASSVAHIGRGDSHGDLTRCASDWQRTFIATFPGHEVDEREFADAVVTHTGATPTYWPFEPQSAVGDIAHSVWAMDDLSGAPAVPVYNIYRTMREHGVVVTLDGHGGDELLAGYPWYRDLSGAALTDALYSDFHRTHLPSILRNFDGCSMANGVEVRSPFLDWELVTYAFALPGSAKHDGTWTKRILRDAMRGIMPDVIRTRTSKLGFESPLIGWANGALGPALRAATYTDAWRSAPAVAQPDALSVIVRDRTTRRAWTSADSVTISLAWRLFAYTVWCDLFLGDRAMVGATSPTLAAVA